MTIATERRLSVFTHSGFSPSAQALIGLLLPGHTVQRFAQYRLSQAKEINLADHES